VSGLNSRNISNISNLSKVSIGSNNQHSKFKSSPSYVLKDRQSFTGVNKMNLEVTLMNVVNNISKFFEDKKIKIKTQSGFDPMIIFKKLKFCVDYDERNNLIEKLQDIIGDLNKFK